MSNHELNRWDWLAFCYLSDELSADDRAAFEASLAVEQVAREALARAVELTCVVAVAESHSTLATSAPTTGAPVSPVTVASQRASSGNGWSRRASWMAVGAAAAVVLMLLGSNLGYFGSVERAAPLASAPSDHQLASAWIATRSEFPIQAASLLGSDDSLADSLAESLAGSLAAADDSWESATAGNDLLANDSPSWMTAALLAQAGRDSAAGPAINLGERSVDETPAERLDN